MSVNDRCNRCTKYIREDDVSHVGSVRRSDDHNPEKLIFILCDMCKDALIRWLVP